MSSKWVFELVLLIFKSKIEKNQVLIIRGMTSKRVTSAGAYFLGLAPGQHSSKKRRSGGEL